MNLFALTVLSGIFVAAASGLVGSFLILRRMALMSDAMSHVALPGIAVGVLLRFNPLLGGLAFLFLGVLLIWLIETKTKLAAESVTGVMFVTALAIGALLIPQQDLLEAFFGSVEKITATQLLFQTLIAVGIIAFILVFMKKLTLFSIAPDLATSIKLSPVKLELVLLTLIALTITIGISFVGILLMSAIAIMPAAAARNLARSFTQFIALSVTLAAVSLTAGLVIGFFYPSLNPGVVTVLASSLLFLISLIR